jgi:subtilisin family serine protease
MDPASVHPKGRLRPLVALASAAVAVAFGAVVSPSARSEELASTYRDGQQVVPGELVVGFAAGAPADRERAAVRQAGGRIEQRIRGVDGAVVTVDAGRADAAVERLSRDQAVEFVEPNFVLRAARVPGDQFFTDQWGLRNVGQEGGKAGADVRAALAWDLTTGGPVTVAVVDTGVDYDHPDLAANVWTNPADPVNGRDDDGDGYTDDVHGPNLVRDGATPLDDAGHGTHVAGIIGARGDNSVGVAGVAWDVDLLPVKFLDADGSGNTADAAAAIDYAVRHGARVINASWGGPSFSQALYDAVKRAGERGALVVAAAGNDGVDADSLPDYPAGFDLPNVISVAATDRYDHLPDFSNYGPATVDLAAPGEDIYSTVPDSVDTSGYASFTGTSMATPFVSGAAALYLSRSPQATVATVRNAILSSVDRLPDLGGTTVSGGRLNVARALGVKAPASKPARDRNAPARFALLRPRNRHASRRRSHRFVWQRSRDSSGIRLYRLFVDGKHVRTVRDHDGPKGRGPRTSARVKLAGGRHRWFVRAYDYSGNRRTSRSFRRSGARVSSVLFIRTARR